MASHGSLFERASERVALVTGAASGIGAATAARLAGEGIGGLVLLDRDVAGLEAQARMLGLPAARLLVRAQDVVDEAAWDATAAQIGERFGRLDLAVVNAGVAGGGPILDRTFADWRHILATNLDGAFLTLRASMRLMLEGERGGAIVVVASAAAVKAEIGTAAYGASKAGAVQLARVAAKEGAGDRIRVNSILPGGVITPLWHTVPFFQDLVAQQGSEEAAFAAMAEMATPLGRYATADEVAEQIVWLLSDRTATMTGSTILLDGGYALGAGPPGACLPTWVLPCGAFAADAARPIQVAGRCRRGRAASRGSRRPPRGSRRGRRSSRCSRPSRRACLA